jgi:hypothetical protein
MSDASVAFVGAAWGTPTPRPKMIRAHARIENRTTADFRVDGGLCFTVGSPAGEHTNCMIWKIISQQFKR